MPVADLSFDGPYGVYHSIYDNHAWVATIGDPGFRYHAALVQFWGLVALRLAGADVVPLDYEPYARRIEEFADEVERQWIRRPMARARRIAGRRPAAASEMRDRRRLISTCDVMRRCDESTDRRSRRSTGSSSQSNAPCSIPRAFPGARGIATSYTPPDSHMRRRCSPEWPKP